MDRRHNMFADADKLITDLNKDEVGDEEALKELEEAGKQAEKD